MSNPYSYTPSGISSILRRMSVLRTREDVFGKRVEIDLTLVEKASDAVGADLGGAGHCAQVAQEEIGNAAVCPHDREGKLVLHSCLVQLERGHAEALTEHVEALDLGLVAANVGHVRDRSQKGDDFPAPEDGSQQYVVR